MRQMNRLNIKLVKSEKQFNDYHTTYDIMAGDLKLGEITHRHSKDTYSITFESILEGLNSEHFRTLVHPFAVTEVEEMLTDELLKIANFLTVR